MRLRRSYACEPVLSFLRDEPNSRRGARPSRFCGTKALTARARSPQEMKIGAGHSSHGLYGRDSKRLEPPINNQRRLTRAPGFFTRRTQFLGQGPSELVLRNEPNPGRPSCERIKIRRRNRLRHQCLSRPLAADLFTASDAGSGFFARRTQSG